jgi:hypothetical protein
MYKKGDLLTIWWFGVLAIVGLGIVLGTVIFYSGSVDTRKVESEIMADKIIKCLNQSVESINFINDGFDIYSECLISKNVFEQSSLFFVRINLVSGDLNQGPYKFGNNALEKDCEVGENVNAKYFPDCTQENIDIYAKNGNKISVNVLAVSNNKGGAYSNDGL